MIDSQRKHPVCTSSKLSVRQTEVLPYYFIYRLTLVCGKYLLFLARTKQMACVWSTWPTLRASVSFDRGRSIDALIRGGSLAQERGQIQLRPDVRLCQELRVTHSLLAPRTKGGTNTFQNPCRCTITEANASWLIVSRWSVTCLNYGECGWRDREPREVPWARFCDIYSNVRPEARSWNVSPTILAIIYQARPADFIERNSSESTGISRTTSIN